MLIDIIRNLFGGQQVNLGQVLPQILATLFIIFCILPLHECAHAWAASKLGDNTARYQGRLTLNPLASFDPAGSLFLLLFGFGWAKPVPIDSRNFKNPRRDVALSSLAGPLSNFLAAVVGAIIFWGVYAGAGRSVTQVLTFVLYFLQYYIFINVALAMFNLIPLPPLDGSKILGAFLSPRALYNYYRYQNIIVMVAFVVLFSGALSTPLNWLNSMCYNSVMWLGSLPFELFGLLS